MKRSFVYILLAAAALMQGCSKYLDRAPLSEPSNETFWKSVADAEAGVNAVYATLPSSRDFWKDCQSDNSVMTNAWGEGGLGYISMGSQSAADAYLLEEWKYDFIYRALNALDKLREMELDANLKKRMSAEVRFALAMRYFRMVKHFGDIPLIRETPVSLENAALSRSPKQEVLNYVLQNVDSAVTNLPVVYTDAKDMGRVTKAGALMLRADVYLYMASYRKFHAGQDEPALWKAAAQAAQEVVNMQRYQLEADYSYLFRHESNNNNKEVILAYQYVPNEIVHMLPVLCLPNGCSITGQGWASFCPTRDLIDSYECTDGQHIRVSPLYDKANPWENRDARMKQTFLLPGVPCLRPDGKFRPYQPHPSYKQPEKMNSEGGGITGYMYLKFAEPENPNPTRSYTNFPIYRYAETWLMLAEALNEYEPANPQIAVAMNEVRKRAGLPVVNALLGNQAAMREKIREERRHEFVAEHKRYFDILRWKIAENVLNKPAYGINSEVSDAVGDWTKPAFLAQNRTFDKTKHYLWPIPESATDKNKKLLPQNPNW